MFGVRKNRPQADRKRELPAIKIEGFRVDLRPARPEDCAQWIAVRTKNKDFLEPFEPRWPPDALTPGFFHRRLARQARDWESGRGNYFLIIRKDGARLIGGMNINNITRGAAQHASLGYWIDEAHESQGYMAEALRLTLRYCFEELKLHRIHAACLPHNRRSRRLLKRGGFAEEGLAEKYLQIDGRWQDHILYGLNVEDWEDWQRM